MITCRKKPEMWNFFRHESSLRLANLTFAKRVCPINLKLCICLGIPLTQFGSPNLYLKRKSKKDDLICKVKSEKQG